MKLADHMIAVPKRTQEKLAVVPNGADVKWIDSVKPSERSFDVVFVGRLIPEKNADILLRPIREGMTVAIVGDGPEQKKLKALSRGLNVYTTFIPSLEYEELIRIIKAAGALVLPSSREGLELLRFKRWRAEQVLSQVLQKTTLHKTWSMTA